MAKFYCGNSGGGGASSKTINGMASKGPISGGNVKVYALKDDGTKGDQLGKTATTASDGSYLIDIGPYTGNVLVEVTDGTYTDEATGDTGKPNPGFKAALAGVSGDVSVAVTPLTDIAVSYAGTLTKDNIDKGNSMVSAMAGIDIVKTMPANVISSEDASKATVDEIAYGLALASISQMIKDGKAAGVSEAISAIKTDLSDGKLDTTGSDLLSALISFYGNTNNKTGVTNANLTKLDDAISYVKDNSITPPATNASDLSKAKALVADLRNTALSIYNYQGVGAKGIVETPFTNLSEELKTKIEPELTDAVDRLGWVIDSVGKVDKGTTGIFLKGSNKLEITISVDAMSGNFIIKDVSDTTIVSGTLTLNDPDKPTSGSFNATMKTATGDLTASLSYTGTISSGSLTSMILAGSMTAPGFSLDFSEDGRKLSATFARNPDSTDPNDIYPTSIFFSGRITTGMAQMDGKLDIPFIVWATKGQITGWDSVTSQDICSGSFKPKTATFNGSFAELKDNSPTGVKFSGVITGTLDNAETYNGCSGDSPTNFVIYNASFDGTIEAPSRPKIETFLKVSRSEEKKATFDIKYTRTNTDGTVVSLSGNGTATDRPDPDTSTVFTASLNNQDGMKVDISEDNSKSGDAKFTGTISTSGGTKMADLYSVNNIPTVKYIDNYIETIL